MASLGYYLCDYLGDIGDGNPYSSFIFIFYMGVYALREFTRGIVVSTDLCTELFV
jgi:hypothetical protein